MLLNKIINHIDCSLRLISINSIAHRPVCRRANPNKHHHLLILPPHPEKPFGSRGDQAMVLATIDKFIEKYPDGLVSIVTSKDGIAELDDLRSLGINVSAFPVWKKRTISSSDYSKLSEFTSLVVIGADVMDGYYWPVSVLRVLLFCEKARLAGVEVGVLGFSFNDNPNKFCINAFKSINKDIRLFSRDPVSRRRFIKYTNKNTELVADSAFGMKPSSSGRLCDIKAWVNSKDDIIVGFNIHNMLFDIEGVINRATAIANFVACFKDLLDNYPSVSLLLIPHDFRGDMNDYFILKSIFDDLQPQYASRLYLPAEHFLANELKAMTEFCHVILTARMHLAIAAIGMKTPVAVISYQGKFEGLLEHIDLPSEYILNPSDFDNTSIIFSWMKNAVENVQISKLRMQDASEYVTKLSDKNFNWLI